MKETLLIRYERVNQFFCNKSSDNDSYNKAILSSLAVIYYWQEAPFQRHAAPKIKSA